MTQCEHPDKCLETCEGEDGDAVVACGWCEDIETARRLQKQINGLHKTISRLRGMLRERCAIVNVHDGGDTKLCDAVIFEVNVYDGGILELAGPAKTIDTLTIYGGSVCASGPAEPRISLDNDNG